MKFKVGFSTLLLSTLIWNIFSLESTSSEGLHLITSIRGEVEIKRHRWFGYRRASTGDTLNDNDQIRVHDSSTVSVRCSNLTLWSMGPGTQKISEGCVAAPSGTSRLRRDDNDIVPGGRTTIRTPSPDEPLRPPWVTR